MTTVQIMDNEMTNEGQCNINNENNEPLMKHENVKTIIIQLILLRWPNILLMRHYYSQLTIPMTEKQW